MSAILIENKISRFLETDVPEVLVITGDWGVGKSYTWNKQLEAAIKAKTLKMKKYSSVSLFGINDLKELRAKIIACSVDPYKNLLPDRSSYHNVLKAGLNDITQLKSLKAAGAVSNAVEAIFYMNFSDHLICIDDIERSGKSLSAIDLLGLISELKERKRCKIVLLLNQDALADREEFERHLDKVADKVLVFRLFSQQALEILKSECGKSDDDFEAAALLLQMNNIRVLRKAREFADEIYKILSGFDERIVSEAVRNAVLCTHSRFEPDRAPPLTYIANRIKPPSTVETERQNEIEWQNRLQHFERLDTMGLIILDGVESGYFDSEAIQAAATTLQNELYSKDRVQKFKAAWDIFHGSFDENEEDDFVEALITTFRESAEMLSLRDVDSCVSTLREMERSVEADEILAVFVNANADKPADFWERALSHAGASLQDPSVLKAATQAAKDAMVDFDALATLRRIWENRGWTEKDMLYLSSLTSQDFWSMFKSHHGQELDDLLSAVRLITQISNPDLRVKSIRDAAAKAMQDIAKESPLNRVRVKFRYPPATDPDAPLDTLTRCDNAEK